MLKRLLFTRIDNSPLIVFRILFGILVSLECYGAIITGWIRTNLVEPDFTFTFIGFEWLHVFLGPGMYFYFFVMGSLGVLIALGYKYRLSMGLFTVLWTMVYLMQKTSYNNHYYLLILISLMMCFLPAQRNFSFDAKINPGIRENSMFAYVKWIIVFQLFIVYTYASIAKLYGDWLNFDLVKLLMSGKRNYFLIGEVLQLHEVHVFIAISGILFDLLIVPALLWKPTRNFAFGCSIFFHLFNSIVFQIGIFPYLSLAFTVFFYEPETIRRIFLPKKQAYNDKILQIPSYKRGLLGMLTVYFLIQLLLPLRHHFIPGDVLWTEEGHRMSWRMMLRSRSGKIQFRVLNKNTAIAETINLKDYLSPKQQRRIAAYPDFIWQFAQHLKKEYAAKGEDISVYVNSKVRINSRPMANFIDPKTDLAAVQWHHFKHHEWILPAPWNK